MSTVPPADPTLPSYLPTRNNPNSNLNNAQGEAFIAFDRDQVHTHSTLHYRTTARSPRLSLAHAAADCCVV